MIAVLLRRDTEFGLSICSRYFFFNLAPGDLMANPSRADLREALSAAGSAHHEFEENFLKGERDDYWAGWYAAYVLGRLGEFTTPTQLTKWLQEADGDGDWANFAADYVVGNLVDL
jgi:hypothetical protein